MHTTTAPASSAEVPAVIAEHATEAPAATVGNRSIATRWSVPPWLELSAAWAWRLLLIGALLWFGLGALGAVRLVVLPVLIAAMIAALLSTPRQFLVDRGVPPLLTAWLLILVAGALLVSVVWITAVSVGGRLADDGVWQEVQTEARDWLQTGPLGLSADEVDRLEDRLSDTAVGGIGSFEFERARFLLELLGATLLCIVLTFFFLKDGEKMWGWATRRVKTRRREEVDRAGREAFAALGNYMRGVAFTGIVDGVLVGIALAVLGVPLVLPLALITALGAFLPIIGATAAGALASLVALVTTGPREAVILAIVTLVIQQVEGDVIMPLVMRRQVRLHPAVVLVSLAVGGAVAGIIGAFVAVPLAAMATAVSGVLRNPNGDAGDREPASAPADADTSAATSIQTVEV